MDFIGYDDDARAERVFRTYQNEIEHFELGVEAEDIVQRCTTVDDLDFQLEALVSDAKNNMKKVLRVR